MSDPLMSDPVMSNQPKESSMSVVDRPVVDLPVAPTEDIPDIPVLDELNQLFLDAERYIREHGWTQRTAQNLRGEVCIGGAVFKAAGIDPGQVLHVPSIVQRAIAHLNTLVPARSALSVVAWNDMPGRRVEDIYALLQKAREVKPVNTGPVSTDVGPVAGLAPCGVTLVQSPHNGESS